MASQTIQSLRRDAGQTASFRPSFKLREGAGEKEMAGDPKIKPAIHSYHGTVPVLNRIAHRVKETFMTRSTNETHVHGPWSATDDECVIATLSNGAVVEVAHINLYDELSHDAAMANCHLIAAAPEMLALVIQYRDDLRYPPDNDSKERRLRAIGAVIAKVAGRNKHDDLGQAS
jgi:hypothetical protein